MIICLISIINHTMFLVVTISKETRFKRDYHAGNIVKELAKIANGKGGGNNFFATMTSKNVSSIDKVLKNIILLLT